MADVDNPIVVLDVGGTTLTAAVVVGDRVTTPVRDSSYQDADAPTILGRFSSVIEAASAGHDVTDAVVAMPAPFDYERGISHMVHKFAALEGVDVGAALAAGSGKRIDFVNDAQAAALGVWVEIGRRLAAVAVVTLGTGVGSGLVVDGELSGHNDLWTEPYLDGIVEDLVSSEVLRADDGRHSGRPVSVADVAAAADSGDPDAIDGFATYGFHLGTSAARYFADVAVESVAVSGGITGAWQHIEPAATAAYRAAGGSGSLVRSMLEYPALVGGAEFGRRTWRGQRPTT